MEELERQFAAWAKEQADIRAAVVIGSRARRDRPADRWSDLDVVMLAADPRRYLDDTDWLHRFGVPCVTFVEPTATGNGEERRVLFEGGLDVDFSVLSSRGFRVLLRGLAIRQRFPAVFRRLPAGLRREAEDAARDLPAIVGRGYRVLFDKDGLFTRLLAALARQEKGIARPPSPAAFQELVHDFWYHALWAARKLRRGELWVAKSACDGSMKRQVLQMLRWHAGATRGWDQDTWHEGRFLEQWADPRAMAELRGAFAHYDAQDVRRALPATMALFRWLARETADRLGYPYPAAADDYVTELVAEILTPVAG